MAKLSRHIAKWQRREARIEGRRNRYKQAMVPKAPSRVSLLDAVAQLVAALLRGLFSEVTVRRARRDRLYSMEAPRHRRRGRVRARRPNGRPTAGHDGT